jgi:hypothetical protein
MSSVVISGDTSGAITLAAPSVAGTNTITLPASTGTVVTTGSPQSGGVIQTAQTVLTTTVSKSSGSGYGTLTDITGLSVSITPKFSTSKILVTLQIGATDWDYSGASSQSAGFALTRNGSLVTGALGAASGSNGRGWFGVIYYSFESVQSASGMYLDSPASTSAQTYQAQWFVSSAAAQTVYINRSGRLSSGSIEAGNSTYCSTITVQEIAA